MGTLSSKSPSHETWTPGASAFWCTDQLGNLGQVTLDRLEGAWWYVKDADDKEFKVHFQALYPVQTCAECNGRFFRTDQVADYLCHPCRNTR